jgi:hypothetical protein
MGKGRILQEYKSMSADDRRTFDRWLKANAVIGAIVSLALVAMAVVGAHSTRSPASVAAAGANPPDVVTTGRFHE